MGKQKTLGRVELEMLQYIDANQPVTVRQVADHWSEHYGQARTTVLTVIDRLKEKGFVTRKKVDGIFQYSTKKTSASVLQTLVSDFVSGTLGGSLAPFVAYLNAAKNVDPQELADLKKIVQDLEQTAKMRSDKND